jgi:cob(I)alamin adenosyltransferase
MKGLVHIYTGDGKGKTTAAIGLAVRACGAGMKVLFVQFLKSIETGELDSFEKLAPGICTMRGCNCKKFVYSMSPEEFNMAKQEATQIFQDIKTRLFSGEYDMVVLDEMLGTISVGFIDEKAVIELIQTKPQKVELILTGRGASQELIEIADYVSEIKAIKHPYDKRIGARKGIEY